MAYKQQYKSPEQLFRRPTSAWDDKYVDLVTLQRPALYEHTVAHTQVIESHIGYLRLQTHKHVALYLEPVCALKA